MPVVPVAPLLLNLSQMLLLLASAGSIDLLGGLSASAGPAVLAPTGMSTIMRSP